MLDFLSEQALFFIAIAFVLFLPGFALLRAAFRKTMPFTVLELFVFSLPASIAVVNFLMIALGKAGVALTAASISSAILVFTLFCLSFSYLFLKRKDNALPDAHGTEQSLVFSKKEGLLIVLILALTVFIKTVYLSQAILPTATDLGHHMYWSKLAAETGQLPEYVERNIVQEDGRYVLGDPEPIDDFIIGEHLVFSAVALISGASFVSAFPALILLLANVFALLAVFAFVLRASAGFSDTEARPDKANAAAILVLLFLGPLYALASPQAKFVSGGVVGNTFGNLFIPVALYFYWRALKERDSNFLTVAFFLTFGLAYIHHLSTLMFLFVAFFSAVAFSLLNIVRLRSYLAQWMKLFLSPSALAFIAVAVAFFFLVLAPSYADPKSVDTALGSPSKSTRAGLTFLQLTLSTGEGRLGLGLVSFAIILLGAAFRKRLVSARLSTDPYADAFFFGWGFALFMMSLRPQWLFLDIPSNRISSYAVFPFAILSALAFAVLFRHMAASRDTKSAVLPHSFATASFVVLLSFVIIGGFNDNSQSLLTKGKAQEAVQTFRVSDYLADKRQPDDLILKDHNYITADSWMKLSFLEGYTYPLSRGYFQRYGDTVTPREQCTLWMIAVPNTPKGEQCFADIGVNVLVVNPHFDTAQFKKAKDFSLVYQSNDVAVYLRNNQSPKSNHQENSNGQSPEFQTKTYSVPTQ
jgi:hypothetical protein